MRILLNTFCKKIYVDYNNKRLISYRTRKSLCFLLSKPGSGRTGGRLPSQVRFTDSEMGCTKFEIFVITNGTCNSSSLYVDLGTRSYLFNCGENVVKAHREVAQNASKLNGIFVTSGHWRHIGGLLGTLLPQKRADKNLMIFGPPEVEEFISKFHVTNMEQFALSFKVDSRFLKQTFDDDIWKVRIVPLCAEQNETETASTSESTGGTQGCLETRSPSQDNNDKPIGKKYVFNYICQSQDFGLHLDIKACKRKNVPVGPLLRRLKNKMDVTLSNGVVVRWQDVCFTSKRQVNFVIADCPSIEYLENFVEEKEFEPCQQGGETPANLIVHFTPTEVFKTEKYFKWMSKFPTQAHHLLLNPDNAQIDFYSAHDFHKQLNYLSPNIFPGIRDEALPVLKEAYSDILWKSSFTLTTSSFDELRAGGSRLTKTYPAHEALIKMPDIFHSINGVRVIRAIPGLSYEYHPNPAGEWRFVACHNPKTLINKLVVPENLIDECADGIERLDNFKREEEAWMKSEACNEIPEYPKIIFLGTGSGEPAIRRSPSSILVQLNEREIILLDCGEGTYNQISRFFGPDKIEEIFDKLKLIYVSHYHMDHYMGLCGLLLKRLKLLEDEKIKTKLALIVPFQVKNSLDAFPSIHGPILKNTVVFDSWNTFLKRRHEELDKFLQATVMSKIETCPVQHCKASCGVSITQKNGYKITYSGDAKPSPALVEIGMNSDILIHEATFDDNLADMAIQKKHSTISDAIGVGKQMNAKFTILTHFSQRYSKVPLIDYANFPSNVVIAFDFMMVNERVLPLMEKLTPLFPCCFGREIRCLEGKSKARSLMKRLQTLDGKKEGNEDEKPPPVKMKRKNV